MERLRTLARAAALPTLSGVLYFLSWIGYGLWPLAFVCFVPFLWSIAGDTPRDALKKGLWFGFVTHLGGYTWLVHLFTVFAFFPLPLALFGTVVVCAFQGAILGLFAWLLRKACTASRWPLALLVPAALCAVEWVYPLLFQSYTGVALYPVLRLVQIADLGGVLLLSALQGTINGALADLALWIRARTSAGGARAPRLPPLGAMAGAAVAFAAASVYGYVRLHQVDLIEKRAPHKLVGIAQPNVGEIELHRNPDASVRTLWDQAAELQARGAELVVWPEAGFNLRAVDLGNPAHALTVQHGVPVSLIAGAIRTAVSERGGRRVRDVWNSALMISPEGRFTGAFDKIKLLAFGEYIPFGDVFPVLYRWSPMSSPYTRGATTAPLVDGRYRYATFICYEAILPGLVRELMAARPEGRPHALVNLTNDSWYGAGNEQEQHLILSAVRSIEHRRWLVRATSTGISAFVDASGRVVQRIPRDVRGVAMREVPMLEEVTVYQQLGDWPGWLGAIVAGLALWRGRRSRRRA